MSGKNLIYSILAVFLLIAVFFFLKEYQKLSWSKPAESDMFVIAIRGGKGVDEIAYLKLSNEIFQSVSNPEYKNKESDMREGKWGNPSWHRLQFPRTKNTDLHSISKTCKEIEKKRRMQPEFKSLKIMVIDEQGNKY